MLKAQTPRQAVDHITELDSSQADAIPGLGRMRFPGTSLSTSETVLTDTLARAATSAIEARTTTIGSVQSIDQVR